MVRYLEHFLLNCLPVNTKPHRWLATLINDDLVPSSNTPLPEPMLTQTSCHMTSLDRNALIRMENLCIDNNNKIQWIGNDFRVVMKTVVCLFKVFQLWNLLPGLFFLKDALVLDYHSNRSVIHCNVKSFWCGAKSFTPAHSRDESNGMNNWNAWDAFWNKPSFKHVSYLHVLFLFIHCIYLKVCVYICIYIYLYMKCNSLDCKFFIWNEISVVCISVLLSVLAYFCAFPSSHQYFSLHVYIAKCH